MRIDKHLADKFGSRTKAAQAVERGLVLVNGRKVAPSYDLRPDDSLTFPETEQPFVSLGGYKLEKALDDFGFDVCGKVFADIGASTGGFTDCLLRRGAQKVYCIDVGESQLDSRLKDKNIVIIDNFNARNLHRGLFKEPLDGAVIDVSFISLTYVLDKVAEVLEDGGVVFALIKPQFECESRNVGKNGVVRDTKKRRAAIEKVCAFAETCSLAPTALTEAPVVRDKNREYVVFLKKGGQPADLNLFIKSVNL